MAYLQDDIAPLEAQAQPMEHAATLQETLGGAPHDQHLPTTTVLPDKVDQLAYLDYSELTKARDEAPGRQHLRHSVPFNRLASDDDAMQIRPIVGRIDSVIDDAPVKIKPITKHTKPSGESGWGSPSHILPGPIENLSPPRKEHMAYNMHFEDPNMCTQRFSNASPSLWSEAQSERLLPERNAVTNCEAVEPMPIPSAEAHIGQRTRCDLRLAHFCQHNGMRWSEVSPSGGPANGSLLRDRSASPREPQPLSRWEDLLPCVRDDTNSRAPGDNALPISIKAQRSNAPTSLRRSTSLKRMISSGLGHSHGTDRSERPRALNDTDSFQESVDSHLPLADYTADTGDHGFMSDLKRRLNIVEMHMPHVHHRKWNTGSLAGL